MYSQNKYTYHIFSAKFQNIYGGKLIPDQLDFAKKVAQNLFNFFESYPKMQTQMGNGEEVIMLPANAFQKWMNKFEIKFRIDPFFVYNTKE